MHKRLMPDAVVSCDELHVRSVASCAFCPSMCAIRVHAALPRAPPADLTDLIAMWCRGVSFADLYKQTEVFEVRRVVGGWWVLGGRWWVVGGGWWVAGGALVRSFQFKKLQKAFFCF